MAGWLGALAQRRLDGALWGASMLGSGESDLLELELLAARLIGGLIDVRIAGGWQIFVSLA